MCGGGKEEVRAASGGVLVVVVVVRVALAALERGEELHTHTHTHLAHKLLELLRRPTLCAVLRPIRHKSVAVRDHFVDDVGEVEMVAAALGGVENRLKR